MFFEIGLEHGMDIATFIIAALFCAVTIAVCAG
jgi:preprotein translocase subunit SecG